MERTVIPDRLEELTEERKEALGTTANRVSHFLKDNQEITIPNLSLSETNYLENILTTDPVFTSSNYQTERHPTLAPDSEIRYNLNVSLGID